VNNVTDKKSDDDMVLVAFEPEYPDEDWEDLDEADIEFDFAQLAYSEEDQEDKAITFEILEDIESDDIEDDNDWNLGNPYVKRWAKYSDDGFFKGWRVRLVQDILLTEEMEMDKISLVTTEQAVDDNYEDDIAPISEMKALIIKFAEAKNLKSGHVFAWVNAVEFKFADIGIKTVFELQRGLVQLNRRLHARDFAMLHARTLQAIVNVADKEVCDMKEEIEIASDCESPQCWSYIYGGECHYKYSHKTC
jgi:hypothetical protein